MKNIAERPWSTSIRYGAVPVYLESHNSDDAKVVYFVDQNGVRALTV